jgi:hypothetical protein
VALLFDEADSLWARRAEARAAHDGYANIEILYSPRGRPRTRASGHLLRWPHQPDRPHPAGEHGQWAYASGDGCDTPPSLTRRRNGRTVWASWCG